MQNSTRNTIEIGRLKTKTVYQLVWLSSWLSIFPFAFVVGLLALAGTNVIRYNDVTETGVRGLLISIICGFAIIIFNTVFLGSAVALGLRIYSLFRPLKLLVVPPIEIRTTEITELAAKTASASDTNG